MNDDVAELVAAARNVPMLEVLDLLDLPHPNATGHIHSIFHDENTPSLHVGTGNADGGLWYDFSSGKGGDTISFVREYFGCSFMRAVRFLVQHADPDLERRTKRPAPVETKIPDLGGHVLAITGKTTETHIGEVMDWMADRWPVDPYWAFDRFKLKVANVNGALELWAPHYWKGQVCGVKIRTLAGRKLAVPGSKFLNLYASSPTGPFDGAGLTAWLVEGESDTWSLEGALDGGFDFVGGTQTDKVYGLPSGAAMMKDEWVRQLNSFDRVMLCLDGDAAGEAAMSKWSEKLQEPWRPMIPGGRVSEAIADGWNPKKEPR